MRRRAKVKSTGEIVDVRVDVDYHGNTTLLDANTNMEYYPSELEFLPDEVDKTTVMQHVLSQFSDDDLKQMLYPYPYETEYSTLEFDDIGYSDRKLCLGVERKDDYYG